MSKTRFVVSPVKGRPVAAMVILADGGSFSVHLGGPYSMTDRARIDGYRLVYGEPSTHWRDADPVEVVSIIQELDPDWLENIPDLADFGPGYASATT